MELLAALVAQLFWSTIELALVLAQWVIVGVVTLALLGLVLVPIGLAAEWLAYRRPEKEHTEEEWLDAEQFYRDYYTRNYD